MTSPPDLQTSERLQTPDDVSLQECEWRWQRYAQSVVLLFVAAGFVGLFGGGWMGDSNARAETDRLQVRHPQFARLQSPCDMHFTISPALVSAGTLTLWIDASLLEGFAIEQFIPQPVREISDGNRTSFEFAVKSGAPFAGVVLRVKPQQIGRVAGEVGVADGPKVRLACFVYP